jgi:hypothetical protein
MTEKTSLTHQNGADRSRELHEKGSRRNRIGRIEKEMKCHLSHH